MILRLEASTYRNTVVTSGSEAIWPWEPDSKLAFIEPNGQQDKVLKAVDCGLRVVRSERIVSPSRTKIIDLVIAFVF